MVSPVWGAHEFAPWLCLGATIAFAALAFVVRAVDRSGAAAGSLICFLLCMGCGVNALAALVAVFVMAWLATRIGHHEKARLGTAEKSGGRSASQVLAN